MAHIVVHHLDIAAALKRDSDALLEATLPVSSRRSDAVQRLWAAGLYKPVADIIVDDEPNACDAAWRLTQNIDQPWTGDPRAGALAKAARSSMIGDLFFVGDEAHVANAPFGFQKVDLPLRQG